MWEYNQISKSDELYHYGVLGMKWGMHRAKKKGISYTYKSHGQKKFEKKYNKLVNKGKNKEKINKTKEKLNLYKTRDKNRQDYAKNTSVGKSFVKTLLLGPIGNGSYSRYRGSGDGRVGAFLKSNIIVSSLGAPISVLLSRGSEFKTARIENRVTKAKE